jgi:peptidoglycan/xylan/chitin deacetylase (PgdA/CDA1 family)
VSIRILIAALAALTASAANAGGKVALTFDDLPVHSAIPAGVSRTVLLKQITNTLSNAGAPPTYGFVNAKALEDDASHRAALEAWRAAGHPLANHTYSHMSLQETDVAGYREEVIANEPILQELMGNEDWHWFRYPYLREGESLEKRNAVRKLLQERGYRIAQVTIDFSDWAYNGPYVRCFEKRDFAAIEELKANYLARADKSITASEQASRRLYGRNIKHVLLLHVGAFQPVMLPHLFELLARRGYDIVTLEEAQSDPAYAEDPGLELPYGTSFLQQMSIRKNLPSMEYDAEGLSRLESLCQ